MVDIGAGDIDEIDAQQPQHEVEDDDEDQADAQAHQGGGAIIGDDPVIDGHGKERRHEREDVDQRGSDRDLHIDAAIAHHRCNQPGGEAALAGGEQRLFIHGLAAPSEESTAIDSSSSNWPALASRTKRDRSRSANVCT